MPTYNPALLSQVADQCYYRMQPQPILDLLNSRGIVGRVAEVFWTYFQWGLQNRSFQCQLSSSYVAEQLFTDVRTIQRANERLVEAGLIVRERARKAFGSSPIEAPAVTRITIPDDAAVAVMVEAPRRRGGKQGENAGSRELAALGGYDDNSESVPASGQQAPSPALTIRDVPKSNVEPMVHADAARRHTQDAQSFSTLPVEKGTHHKSVLRTDPESKLAATRGRTPGTDALVPSEAASLVVKAREALPPDLRRAYDTGFLKASPRIFLDAAMGCSDLPTWVREALCDNLENVAEAKRRDLQFSRPTPKVFTTVTSRQGATRQARKEGPRIIPQTLLTSLNEKLSRSCGDLGPKSRSLLSELVYSITVGTMRELDAQHAINAMIKLVRHGRWTKPKGMPAGWRFDHLVAA